MFFQVIGAIGTFVGGVIFAQGIANTTVNRDFQIIAGILVTLICLAVVVFAPKVF